MARTKYVPFAMSALLLGALACNALLLPAEPTPTMVVILEPTFPQQQPDLPETEADVPRVSIEEALTAYSAGAAIIVDVRSTEDYNASHIPGALSIPLDEFEIDPSGLDLDKEQWIITYCT